MGRAAILDGLEDLDFQLGCIAGVAPHYGFCRQLYSLTNPRPPLDNTLKLCIPKNALWHLQKIKVSCEQVRGIAESLVSPIAKFWGISVHRCIHFEMHLKVVHFTAIHIEIYAGEKYHIEICTYLNIIKKNDQASGPP